MKVAVFGHTGFLGKNVVDQLVRVGVPHVGASRRTGLDRRDTEATAAFLALEQPDAILHCAAHVGSFNYVTENASAVMLDNSRMALALHDAMARVCPQAVVVHPLANCVYPASAEIFL